jgi:hypothetical protein
MSTSAIEMRKFTLPSSSGVTGVPLLTLTDLTKSETLISLISQIKASKLAISSS